MIERDKGFLSFEKFKIAADKIRPFAKLFYLHIWGEPMLNKKIIPMVRYASQFSRTNISTNGLMLTSKLAEELITSGVAEVIVSIDGVTQEVYEKYRVGGDVEKAFHILEMLVRLNRQHEAGVHILPQFIVFKHNQHEMSEFKERCHTLGLTPFFKSPYIRTKNSTFSYSDYPELRRPHFKDLPSLKQAMRDCANPRNVFTILLDGSVVACCHDYARITMFGNIFEQDVLEIWNSPVYKKFRRDLIEGNTPKFCLENCMIYFLDSAPKATANEIKIPIHTIKLHVAIASQKKINLCSGARRLEGYINIDAISGADITLDLDDQLLPIENDSVDVLICMSAINYFSRERAVQIVRDVHRVLKPNGIARFGTQDLRLLVEKYLTRDANFYFEKLPDGRDRFPGRTYADKLNEFFYGFRAGNKHCQYVYDFESLREVFIEAGFSLIEERQYRQSRLSDVEIIDNRPEQMFFLEAIKTPLPIDIAKQNYFSTSTPSINVPNSLDGFHQALQRFRTLSSDASTPLLSASPSINTGSVLVEPEKPREKALTLWRQGDYLRAWQWLCATFEDAPWDREVVKILHEVLRQHERWSDLAKLLERYLTANPLDIDARSDYQTLPSPLPQSLYVQNVLTAQQRPDLALLTQRRNMPGSDRHHLDAAIQWIQNAQMANPGGGISAMYYIAAGKWDVDYPETTGYTIPTLLAYARLTGKTIFHDAAVRAGEWQIQIQTPEGGAGEPLGVFGLRPRIFNTGQVILGWVALYRATRSTQYLEAAQRAANWIIENLEADGRWEKNTYSGPHAYKSRVSWALLEIYSSTRNQKYLEAAKRSLSWIMSQSLDNGWFKNNSLSEPGKPWTHLIGYALLGLLETVRMDGIDFDKGKILHLLHEAAKGMMTHYLIAKEKANDKYVTLAATFDHHWQSTDDWSCVTGTAQVEFFLRRLSNYIVDPQLNQTADALIDDLKRLQFIDEIDDMNIFGGMPGSAPLSGPYCGYAIPNWGIKFFADCLLQRIIEPSQQDCLG